MASSSSHQIYVAVIGIGGVGKCFLNQLATLSTRLAQQTPSIHLSPILLSRSRQAIYSDSYRPLQLSSWQNDLSTSTQPVFDNDTLVTYLSNAPGRVVLVDNTSSEHLGNAYPAILKSGVSIVTPNKKAFSGSYELWASIFSSAANGSGGSNDAGYVFHESTVGAGLPVLTTLRDLVDTGDTVTKIQGVFSGTMSFLFNGFMPAGPAAAQGGSFSAEVAKAKELGYTEPDPRDDLNGLDVARKLTILARLVGLKVQSPSSFPIQSLVPAELDGCGSGDEFMARLHEFDHRMSELRDEAASKGKVVRFVGSIDVAKNDIKVGVESFDSSHPIAALQGSDNIISIYTKRYGDKPLIVQGAGAGGDVTAMGTTADLLRAVRLLVLQ